MPLDQQYLIGEVLVLPRQMVRGVAEQKTRRCYLTAKLKMGRYRRQAACLSAFAWRPLGLPVK